jgi:hypothetical protein
LKLYEAAPVADAVSVIALPAQTVAADADNDSPVGAACTATVTEAAAVVSQPAADRAFTV